MDKELLILEMLRLFRGDSRRVMQQKEKGGYGVLHSGKLTANDLSRHIDGYVSASIYLLDENRQCSTLCFDIDIPKIDIPKNTSEIVEKKKSDLLPIIKRLIDHIKSSYNLNNNNLVLEDTGGRGFHLWLFFEVPQPGDMVVNFGNEIRRNISIENIEIFPSSSNHGPSGFSKSNLRLPQGIHRNYSGARSTFLDIVTFENIPISNSAEHLKKISFSNPDILKIAHQNVENKIKHIIMPKDKKNRPKAETNLHHDRYFASIGNMLNLCPALSNLISKAHRTGHLLHNERVALGIILLHCEDGEKKLHEIFKYCTDYSFDETHKHLNSLKVYRPVSCRTLQGPNYNICKDWCCNQFKKAASEKKNPTPLWTAKLNKPKEEINTDIPDDFLIEKVASIENLQLSFKQAKILAKERDIFEDILAYNAFEEYLDANLHILRYEILCGRWKHQPFRIVYVPKSKENVDNKRPMCWATPWDSIVSLAVLNVIGPLIDSTFHDKSYGNRLSQGQKADGQIFEDWRKQNRIREIRREGFSEYGKEYYYIITDIKRFYEFVKHDRLMVLLRKHFSDQKVLDLVQQFIEAEWLHNGEKIPRNKSDETNCILGIPQGPVLSNFLANLYLNYIDYWLEGKCVDFVRYVDDFALLFENIEDARRTFKSFQSTLKNELYLEINDNQEKTKGPYPATDITCISDWIKDARYELVKYSRRAGSLSISEKNEMREALKVVSGAMLERDNDLEKLIKYLGFYIANTERLEQPELQKGVYALATFALNELRPKHNATCIAIKALIKACIDYGDEAWLELNKLLESRSDDYFHIVFAQETRRFLEESESELTLPEEILNTLENQAKCESLVSSAAALTCLTKVKKISSNGKDILWNLCFSDNDYLRNRAIFVSSIFNEINSTTISRILPGDGEEAAILFLVHKFFKSKVVLEAFVDALKTVDMAMHSASAMLFASLIVGCEKGINYCAGLGCFSGTIDGNDIFFHISKKIVRFLIKGEIKVNDMLLSIKTAASCGFPNLAVQIYNIGRYSQVIADHDDINNLLESYSKKRSINKEGIELPTARGIHLEKCIMSISQGVWLHLAKNSEGISFYHEVLNGNELKFIGQNIQTCRKVLESLKNNNILIFDEIEIQKRDDVEYIIISTKVNNNWKPLSEFIKETSLRPDELTTIINSVVEIISKSEKLFTFENLPQSLMPVPSCHTLVINNRKELHFEFLTLSMAKGRTYIGLSEKEYILPRDHWMVSALSTLFFELATAKCVVLATQNASKQIRLAEAPECKIKGALFSSIIGKAWANHPENRYDNPEFLFKDIQEWSKLESALSHSNLEEIFSNRLRKLWQIQISVERRIYIYIKEHKTIIDTSSSLANYILEELNKAGELKNEWIKKHISEIQIKQDKYTEHIAKLQINQLGKALEDQWLRLSKYAKVQRTFTLHNWLFLAAAFNEIDAFSRIICEKIKNELNSVCLEFYVKVDDSQKLGQKLEVKSVGNNVLDNFEESYKIFEKYLPQISQRIKKWLNNDSQAHEAEWPIDFLSLSLILILTTKGIKLLIENTPNVIGPISSYRNIDANDLIKNCFKLFCFEMNGFKLPDDEGYLQKFLNCVETISRDISSFICNFKEINRLFATLPESAFIKLYTERLTQLDLTSNLKYTKKKILAPKSALLPFPKISFYHKKDCPFSIDIMYSAEGEKKVLSLSLPPIVNIDNSDENYPLLKIIKKTKGFKSLLNCIIGKHLLVLLPIPALFLLQVILRDTDLIQNHFFSVLDTWLSNGAIGIFIVPYGIMCIKRFKKKKNNENEEE